MLMQRTDLINPSTLVKSVDYDPDFQILEVELHTAPGVVYRLSNVGRSQYEALIDPEKSAGRAFNEIKRAPGIACERVEVPV